MSDWTIELRTLYENSNVDLGLKNYPLYVFKNIYQDPTEFGKDLKGNYITNFRDYLNNYIIRHFYFREIGYETTNLFVMKLNTKMEELMIKYNQMFNSIDINFNPLWNVDLTETFTHEVNDEGTTNGTTTGNETIENETNESGTNVRNEDLEQIGDNTINNNNVKTPNLTNDTTIAEMNTPEVDMTTEQIRQHGFVSKASHNVNTSSGTETDTGTTEENLKTTNDNTITTTNDNSINGSQTNNSNSETDVTTTNKRTETYTRKQEGSSAGYLFTQNIQEWRKIMINIPDMICRELEPCFIQLF